MKTPKTTCKACGKPTFKIENMNLCGTCAREWFGVAPGKIEQLARDLLARLSQDYGDYEGELGSEVASLFERGELLLPIIATDDLENAMRAFDESVEQDDPWNIE